jgi:type I restriction-modification system DNA methylase subunit
MPAPDPIRHLVATFGAHLDHYKSNNYNETELRREFLDPFFRALGWDIDNEAGYADAYKDVIHEDAIKIGGATKAPDYCFRIGGSRKFFLEAKKPAVDIKNDSQPAYQLRRYAWSAKLPLSVLSDFEEFAVYDCRVPPNSTDKASTARTFYCTFDQFIDKWDEISEVFSRNAVLRGGFDKYAESNKKKRGTAEVDDAFLEEIERWRELLAKNFALRNGELTVRDLNFAVQKTIDRLIFLRICEDRGTEDYGRLQAIESGQNTYGRLLDLFAKADDRYNSGLFHFKHEKAENGEPDELTPLLRLDDKPLKDILKNLYYPASRYEFSVISADILGQVYERFLGKTITLTAGHHARIEVKPEVRKSGGVYYTPTYIVEFIVNNTLGRMLNGTDPADPKPIPLAQAAGLTILDPACGSGSFLIVAYQFLLDWHLVQYVKRADLYSKGKNPRIYQGRGGNYRLTTSERKRILLANIHGVDIDQQAVEVTKLSLLLKVLEGETDQIVQRDWLKERQRILPDLGANIKCGNSLIAPDIYDNEQLLLLDKEAQLDLNAFDWKAEFPNIIKSGGFDCVIGNPPYLFSAGQQFTDYFDKKYTFGEYQTDFYVYFSEQSLELTKRGGVHSFIVTDSWLNGERFTKFRNHLLAKQLLSRIAVFDFSVFRDASIENAIYVATPGRKNAQIEVVRFVRSTDCRVENSLDPAQSLKRGIIDPHFSAAKASVVSAMEKNSIPLGDLVRLNRGLHPYRTDGYGSSKFSKGPQTKRDKDEKSYHSDEQIDSTYIPEVKGRDVFRYVWKPAGKFISYGDWLAEPRTREFFYSPKIVLRKVLGSRLSGAYVETPAALDQSLYIAIASSTSESKKLLFVLGILLSKVGAFYLRTKYSIYDRLFPWYSKKQLAEFPIPASAWSGKHSAERLNKLIALVEKIQGLNASLMKEKNPENKKHLLNMIGVADKIIDRTVYDLYDLSAEQIDAIEGSGDVLLDAPVEES